MPGPGATAEIGIFGGSGFYELLPGVDQIEVDTPFGPPSAPVTVGELAGRTVAFLPRHGLRHEHVPHRINYRANLWAMHRLGVTEVLAPFAAGSLQPRIHPGDLVVCDQLVDRTWGRADTYYEGPTPHHVAYADPYCARLSSLAVAAARGTGASVHEGGTVVVVQGPRFSTRAESRWYRQQGWAVVNMTQYPEAYLARELGICYAAIALVTDYDTGVEDDPSVASVSQAEVFEFFKANLGRLRDLLGDLVGSLFRDPVCACREARGPLPG